MCACVRACVRACMRACVRACGRACVCVHAIRAFGRFLTSELDKKKFMKRINTYASRSQKHYAIMVVHVLAPKKEHLLIS